MTRSGGWRTCCSSDTENSVRSACDWYVLAVPLCRCCCWWWDQRRSDTRRTIEFIALRICTFCIPGSVECYYTYILNIAQKTREQRHPWRLWRITALSHPAIRARRSLPCLWWGSSSSGISHARSNSSSRRHESTISAKLISKSC